MPVRLLQLDHAAALEEAGREKGNGIIRARCLADQLAPAGLLWVSRLDQNEFLSLAWQETDHTRQLTEPSPRTLRTIAQRILQQYGSFERLVSAAPIHGSLDPSWFASCPELAAAFSWEKFGKPWLVPATDSERRGSPETALYVCEGVHRTLVAAVGLLDGTVRWKPMSAVVADKRPAGCC
jgi:hypothetical protein